MKQEKARRGKKRGAKPLVKEEENPFVYSSEKGFPALLQKRLPIVSGRLQIRGKGRGAKLGKVNAPGRKLTVSLYFLRAPRRPSVGPERRKVDNGRAKRERDERDHGGLFSLEKEDKR